MKLDWFKFFTYKEIAVVFYPKLSTQDLFRFSATTIFFRDLWFKQDHPYWIDILKMKERMFEMFKWHNVTFMSFCSTHLKNSWPR